MSVHEKLKEIQTMLKAPKNLYNKYGGFNYRNAEGIYEAVKPLLDKLGMTLIISDSIQAVGTKNYVKATAYLTDCETGEQLSSCALAREAETKKGMDDSQITGTASSYARKYALNGLFNIDDTSFFWMIQRTRTQMSVGSIKRIRARLNQQNRHSQQLSSLRQLSRSTRLTSTSWPTRVCVKVQARATYGTH